MQAMELTFKRAVRLVATPTPIRETATRASTKVKAATFGGLWRLLLIIVIIKAIVIPPEAVAPTIGVFLRNCLIESYARNSIPPASELRLV